MTVTAGVLLCVDCRGESLPQGCDNSVRFLLHCRTQDASHAVLRFFERDVTRQDAAQVAHRWGRTVDHLRAQSTYGGVLVAVGKGRENGSTREGPYY